MPIMEKFLQRVDEVLLDLRQIRPLIELSEKTVSILRRHTHANRVLPLLSLHPNPPQ
jgi:hypothetical protein